MSSQARSGAGVSWMPLAFWILGLGNLANGLWMLFWPEGWYHDLPAGVPDTGPLNLHFVRDLGAAFVTMAAVFFATARNAQRHRGVVIGIGCWYVLHSIIHLYDVWAGLLDTHHLVEDIPLVYIPTVILIVLSHPRWWADGGEIASSGLRPSSQ